MSSSGFIFLFCGQFCICAAGNFLDLKNLHSDLAHNINPRYRPVLNQSETVTANVFVSLSSIQEINEREQYMTSLSGISFTWMYETLKWNSSDYGDISKLTLFADETWVPEVMVGNALRNEHHILLDNGMAVELYSSGFAMWHTGGTFKTTCPMDISKYPFDTQTCVVQLSTSVADSELGLVPIQNKVLRVRYEENEEWFLESSSITKQPMGRDRSFLAVRLVLQRRPLFYIINIIVPVVMVSFMNILSFKIPPRSGERMSYCVALLLAFVVLLNSTGETMPRLSENISYLQVYINCQFVLAFLVTTISALMVKAEHSETQTDLPRWLQMLLMKSCSRRTKIDAINLKTVDNEVECIENNVDEKNVSLDKKEETIGRCKKEKMTDCLDNVLFNIFVALFVISTIVCASLILT